MAAKKIATLLRGIAKVAPAAVREPALVNGALGAHMYLDGRLDTVVGFAVADGRITRLFLVHNPAKLSRITAQTPLARL